MASSEGKCQSTPEYSALTEMTEDLYSALPIDDLLPKMISKRVITFHEKTDIRSGRTDRDQVDKFISKLTGEMNCGVNERFYKFIEAMEESPKCDFLVKRMRGWINHYQKGTPPPILKGSQPSVSQPTYRQASAPVTQDHDGHLVSDMRLMHRHVIPRVSAQWETVAAHLEYSIPAKNLIKTANRGQPRECCTELLEDWISTDNGVKPKTWERFTEVLSEISSLAMVTKQIKYCLQQEGVLEGRRISQGAPQQQMMIHHQPMLPPAPQQPCPTEVLDVEKRLELQKEVFTTCRNFIVKYLSPDDVMDTLVSKSLIGDNAYQQLRLPIMTPQEKNRTIVDELSSGGPGAFEEFCAILKKNRRTKHIADHLEKEWRELLQSLQNDGEQPQYSPPIHTKVVTAPPQTNTVTTSTRRQQEITATQQVIIQETITDPVDQGNIIASPEQPVSESLECREDFNSQEVTSPVSESEEGYFHSTGINLEQERNGQVDTSSVSALPLPPTTKATTVTTTSDDVTVTHHGDVTVAHGDVTTTLGNVTIAAATTTATASANPAPDDVTHNVSDEDSLVTGKDSKKCMRLMRICVIPKISEEWEAVAAFLDYTIQEKNDIEIKYTTPKECCTALLENWVTTDNGVKPKTWEKLMEVLSEVDELEPLVEDIKQCLVLEGASFDGTASPKSQPHHPSHNLESQQGYPHQNPYDLEDQSTDDADLSWNHQPVSSVNTMASSELLQTNLNNHPSYNVPSVEVDQRYGKQMGANQPPQPVPRQQPHAFIVYAKEESDPHGEQLLCLSNLLHNCGINCDIDLNYIDENNTATDVDWPRWIENNLINHIAYLNCFIILVCSPTMISLLNERNTDAHVVMVAAHIHSQILRNYLQQYADKFLPLLINDPSTDYVHPSLTGQTCYYFPYYKLNELPENVSTFDVFHHPDFASMKSLVDMLTGQQETHVAEHLEPQSTGGAPPTDGNATPNAPGTFT